MPGAVLCGSMSSASITAAAPAREPENRLAQLIMSVFALYAREHDNWLSVAVVVQLLASLGADGQAVRSSVSRLKRRGTLVSEKRDRVAGYSMPPRTLELLADGDVRIFSGSRAVESDGWVLVIFSVPESERTKRHALRSTLTQLGFGTVAPGIWIAPGTVAAEARHALERRALSTYANLFVGTYETDQDLRTAITQWWNLEELDALFSDFVTRFAPVREEVLRTSITSEAAFAAYVPLLTQWRRLPYRDPGIPLSLLPEGWRGETARTLFDELNHTLRPLAQTYAREVIGR